MGEALAEGAAGVQVGTAFAFTVESGLRDDLKKELLAQATAKNAAVFTDPLASPTGFPFKVAQIEGTSSASRVYEERVRMCDLGFLREAYVTPEGKEGYRCSAEPVTNYVAKGGAPEEAAGRKCLCNALMANVGKAQIRGGGATEPALVTVGDDLNTVAQFLAPGATSYTAEDVVNRLLGGTSPPTA
jgi:nitronate monooxygenase